MNKHFNLVYILILFCFSCSHEKEASSASIIDISETYNNRQKVNLSSVATKIEYIPLETDSSYLISYMREPHKNIRFHDDLILISDLSGRLYLFNSSGKFLNKIGSVGRGPGEYANTDTFTVVQEKSDSLIAVHSAAQHKTFLYDFSGEFIRDLDIDFYPRGLASVANNLVFINPIGGRNFSDYYTMSVFSTNGGLKERLFHKKEEEIVEQRNRLAMTTYFYSYKKEDTLSYWESNYDTIWRITEELEPIPEFVIDIGDNKMPLEEQTEEEMFNTENFAKYDQIERMSESNRFAFFNIIFKRKYHTIYYDKLTKESVSVQYRKTFGRGIEFSFFNDIDGGMPFWPDGVVSGSRVFKMVHAYEIKEYLEKAAEQEAVVTDNEARERLRELLRNSKDTDNPFLMVVTLK